MQRSWDAQRNPHWGCSLYAARVCRPSFEGCPSSEGLAGNSHLIPRSLFKPDAIVESSPRSCSSKDWKGRERTDAECYIHS